MTFRYAFVASAAAALSLPALGPGPHGVAPQGPVRKPALPLTYLNTDYVPPTGKVRNVAQSGDLQAALDAAEPGDVVQLAPGATFRGTYVLPRKTGNGTIVVRTNVALGDEGTRMTPSHAAEARLAKLVAVQANAPALRTAAGTSGWRIMGIEMMVDESVRATESIVRLGDGSRAQNELSRIPSNIVLDRVYVHGHPRLQLQRCLSLQSASSAVIDSYISECHGKGFDSQAIVGWNGPGPYKIVNNTLEGVGENVMFGGADPSIPNLIPSDIEFRRNFVYSPASWIGVWTKKNLLETKNVQRFLIEGNVFDGSWGDGQVGFAIMFKSANSSGQCTWCTSRDITVRYNVIRNAAGAFDLLGREGSNPYPVGELLNRVLIEQNIVENISVAPYIGDSKMVQLLDGAGNVIIRNNTMTSPASFKTFLTFGTAPAVNGFDYHDNIVAFGAYGMCGAGLSCNESLLPRVVRGTLNFQHTVIIGGHKSGFPSSTFVSSLSAAQATGAGANTAMVNSAIANVEIP